jgi:hypothetical protein
LCLSAIGTLCLRLDDSFGALVHEKGDCLPTTFLFCCSIIFYTPYIPEFLFSEDMPL